MKLHAFAIAAFLGAVGTALPLSSEESAVTARSALDADALYDKPERPQAAAGSPVDFDEKWKRPGGWGKVEARSPVDGSDDEPYIPHRSYAHEIEPDPPHWWLRPKHHPPPEARSPLDADALYNKPERPQVEARSPSETVEESKPMHKPGPFVHWIPDPYDDPPRHHHPPPAARSSPDDTVLEDKLESSEVA
ncbi:hypothetical protein ACEQ8H_006951 [Pleosporales sp. CAS-2024a]